MRLYYNLVVGNADIIPVLDSVLCANSKLEEIKEITN